MTEICTICNQPKDSGSQGSITQWVFICRCDLKPNFDDVVEKQICGDCGKVVLPKREGSMTQWIFRPDSCRCKKTAIKGSKPDSTAPGSGEGGEKKELNLNPLEFPVERYKPIEYLGRGTYGEVVLCLDRKLNKKVAVKKLHSDEESFLVQFQNEARLISKLEHSNIIQILDFGVTEGGYPFMVLEHVGGVSLRTFLDENQSFSVFDSCFIISEISKALSHAHQSGVMHRDISSDNVLIVPLDNKLQIKVIDFGIAKIKESIQETEEGSTTIAGSPLYMSADQARGLDYTAQSEIYSIGCLFFELLTGKVPFEGETALETISMHAHQKAPAIKDVKDIEVPNELEKIITRCLEKDPQNRYQSVDELAQELDSLMRSEKINKFEAIEKKVNESPKIKHKLNKPALLTGILALILIPVILWIAIDKPTTQYHKIKTVPLRGVLRDLEKEKGTFSEGIDDTGQTYTFPIDFLDCNDEDLKELQNRKIKSLALWNCPIDGSGLKYIKNVPLQKINLTGSQIEDKNLKYLNEVKTLESISLNETIISKTGIKQLGHSDKLKLLSLSACSRIDDGAVALLVNQFPNLEILRLSKSKVSSSGLKELVKLKKLRNLTLAATSFTDSDIAIIKKLPLRHLNLNHTKISNNGLLELGKIKTLKVIYLLDCKNINSAGRRRLMAKRPDIRISFRDE